MWCCHSWFPRTPALGCLPIIPVTTVRPLCLSPWNSLFATCNVSQFLPCFLRPLLIHNLQSDASSGVLVALRTMIGKTSVSTSEKIIPTTHLYSPLTLVKQARCDISFVSLDKDRGTYTTNQGHSVCVWGNAGWLLEVQNEGERDSMLPGNNKQTNKTFNYSSPNCSSLSKKITSLINMAWLEYIHIRLGKGTEPGLHHLDQPSNKDTISLEKLQRHRIQFKSTKMQRKITCIYGLYSAVKWQYFLSQYHCLHLFSIKMLPYGNAWNGFSGWNSFMVIIPYRLYWKYCSVLCCLTMSGGVACYFQHLSRPSPADFIFVAFAQTHRKLFSAYSPMTICPSAATFHHCFSFYPQLTQRGGVKHSTMALRGYYFVLSHPADIVV